MRGSEHGTSIGTPQSVPQHSATSTSPQIAALAQSATRSPPWSSGVVPEQAVRSGKNTREAIAVARTVSLFMAGA